MHAAAVTSSIMRLSLSKFHLAPKNFKLSCVQLMISSGSPLNVLDFSSVIHDDLKRVSTCKFIGTLHRMSDR